MGPESGSRGVSLSLQKFASSIFRELNVARMQCFRVAEAAGHSLDYKIRRRQGRLFPFIYGTEVF